MATHNPSADAIAERASYWAARLNENDVSDADRQELHAWLLADERHAVEFRAHNALIALARDFPHELQTRMSGLLSGASGEADAPWRRWAWPAALAAAALIALVAGGWFMLRAPAAVPLYTTRTGEMRTITFDDGNVAYLNTRTQLKWIGSKRESRVALDEGEVLFDVAHDANRPFRVMLGNSEIQVLGTRFNVYRKKNGEITVTVIEGKISVKGDQLPTWQRQLVANQRIVYGPLGLLQDVHEVGPDPVNWRQGVLRINNQPLSEVLDELTRYTDQRIVILDPRVAELHVGGVVPTRDVRVALDRLQTIVPLRVTENGDTFTLDYRADNEDQTRKN